MPDDTIRLYTSNSCALCIPVKDCLERIAANSMTPIKLEVINVDEEPERIVDEGIGSLPTIVAGVNGMRLIGMRDDDDVKNFVMLATYGCMIG